MKKIRFSIFLFILLLTHKMLGQINISPNAEVFAICPLIETEFTLSGIPTNCTMFVIELTAGTLAANTSLVVNGNKFKLVPADLPQELTVRIRPLPNETCVSTTDFKIPVRSINGQAPTFTGCQDIVIGRSESFNLTAILELVGKFYSSLKSIRQRQIDIFAKNKNERALAGVCS